MADFLLDKAFDLLYAGVKDLAVKNFHFKSFFEDTKSKLDEWVPLIKEMADYSQKMNRPEDLEDLKAVIEKGQELVKKCSTITQWNPLKKHKYSGKLLKWEESLKRPLEKLKELEALHVMKIAAGVTEIGVGVTKIDSGVMKIDVGVTKIDAEVTKIDAGVIDIGVGVTKIDAGVTKIEGRVDGICHVINDVHMLMKQQSAESSTIRSRRLEPPPLPPLVVGLDGPLKDLKAKLLSDDGVSMLVLTAPGGCGKTTLATMFCQDEEVKGKFKDNIIFVTVSQNGNLELVVKRLCECMKYPVPGFQNEVQMSRWIQRFRKQRSDPLLLVLDDIWPGSEFILQSFQFQMSDYKILVTSRSEFPRFGSSYHLKLLDDDKAVELFYDTSLSDKPSPTLEDLARKIVKRCSGFPLAITLVGKSLFRQPIEAWRKKDSELSNGFSILDHEMKLLFCLQSSLDALDKEFPVVKDCYLDLGSFPENKRIPVGDLIDIWAELYDLDDDSAFANIRELGNRSLATLVDERNSKMEGDDYYGDRFVVQHGLLRELAIYNAKLNPVEERKRIIIETRGNKWRKEQKYQPTKARLLSITTDVDLSMKWPDMQLPEAEVFVLNFRKYFFSIPEFVGKMHKLKVVVLVAHGLCELGNLEFLELLPNLKRLSLENIPINIITKNPIQLKSLKKLSLKSCGINVFLSEGVGKMSDAFPNLEELNLDECPQSEELLADFCDVIPLKKISIFHCHIRCLPEEIGNLVNLEVLRLRRCINADKFPGSLTNLKKLNFLDISGCYKIQLHEDIGELRSLRKIDMRHSSLRGKTLPHSVSNLDQLEEVICDEFSSYSWECALRTRKNVRIVVIPY